MINRRLASKQTFSSALAFAASMFLNPAAAYNFLDGDLQIHGFAGQTAHWTSDNNYFGDSTDGSFEFTELGLNASWRATKRLTLAIQGVTRNAGETATLSKPFLDYALADYAWELDSRTRLGLRAGRVKNPVGLYNTVRDTPASRPTIHLANSIYFDAIGLREFLLSTDGINPFFQSSYGEHDFNFEFVIGEPRDETTGAKNELTSFTGLNGELEGDFQTVWQLGYNWRGGQFRVLLSSLRYRRDFKASDSDPVGDGKISIDYDLLSLQHNRERLSVTIEAALIDVQRTGFSDQAFSHRPLSYYAQLEYRLTDKLIGLMRYNAYHFERDDKHGRENSNATGGALPASVFFGKDWTAGITWHFTDHWMLRGAYQYTNGIGWLSVLDNPNLLGAVDIDSAGGERYWHMLSLQLAVQF